MKTTNQIQAPADSSAIQLKDRRQRARVQVQLPCRVRRGPGQSASRCQWHETENMSRTGLLIRWPDQDADQPKIGHRLLVEVQLPENPVFGQRWLRYTAKVVHVRKSAKQYLVALAATRISQAGGRKEQMHAPQQSKSIH